MRAANIAAICLCLFALAAGCTNQKQESATSDRQKARVDPGPRAPTPAEGDDLVGAWEGNSGAGGLKEAWTISHDRNGWSVTGVFKKGDQLVGSWRGKDATYAAGALSFHQEYSQKPEASWSDGNLITVRARGDRLEFTWSNGALTGTNSLERAAPTTQVRRPPDTEPDRVARTPGRETSRKPPDSGTKPPPKTAPQLPSLSAEGKAALEKLQGAWQFTDFLFDGKRIDFGAVWSIKGQSVVEDIGGIPRRSGAVWLDATAKPKAFDVHFTKSDGGGLTGMFRGLYELDGDKLTLCLGSDEARPTELTSTPGSKNVLMIFNRKK